MGDWVLLYGDISESVDSIAVFTWIPVSGSNPDQANFWRGVLST